jgi:hypothetical protein
MSFLSPSLEELLVKLYLFLCESALDADSIYGTMGQTIYLFDLLSEEI